MRSGRMLEKQQQPSTRAFTSETIAEIEPLVPRVVSKYLADYNFIVVANPKVTVHLTMRGTIC